jgi:hypothetical protein
MTRAEVCASMWAACRRRLAKNKYAGCRLRRPSRASGLKIEIVNCASAISHETDINYVQSLNDCVLAYLKGVPLMWTDLAK